MRGRLARARHHGVGESRDLGAKLGELAVEWDLTLGKTLEYEYDANGNRTRMVGPEGTVDYVYDSRDMLVTQHDSATGTYRYTYDGAGRRTSVVFPNGNVTEYVS